MFGSFRSWFTKTVERYKSNAMVDIIWMVDVLPHRSNLYWTIQLIMCVYIYGGGTFVYQTQYAEGPYEFIKGYVSFSIVMLNGNSSYWFWSKRDTLQIVYSLTLKNDNGVSRKGEYHISHVKSLRTIKLVVIAFYVFNIVDAWALYMPHRIDLSMDFAMVPCIGVDLSIHPQRELCSLLITYQEVSITNSVLNYQIIILLLISHTSLMYQQLSEEMADIEKVSHRDANFDSLVAERLTNIINRHVLLLETVARLRDLYTLPIGITFGTNAICIMLFFFVPLNESVKFIPVLFYAVLVHFLYCYLVQKLINGAEAFEIAVYGCGWERFRLEERQLIYNMLVQAQKPVVILAADIVHVNIATFASTVQGLYKFVTVMKF